MNKPYDQIVTIDYETVWDRKTGYSLSMMTTEEYIRHERFHAFGACVRVYGSEEPIVWLRGRDLHKHLMQYDWGRTAVLAHNAQFDVAILEWEYDIHPCFIFDTLSMARALRGIEVGNSLAKLAEEFGLPPKGTAVYTTEGYTSLTPAMELELAEYCKHDVYLCEQIFERLVKGYPAKELRLIDMTLKMYTRPVLNLDSAMLVNALHEEKEKREALLSRLGVDESTLASNLKFAGVLESLGIPAPRKTSKTTGKSTLALAKNDAMFQALLNGENEDVSLLCEARIAVKSTTERTRAQRFLDISKRGPLPVPLSYYGASTGRWTASKGSAINMQNLKRGSFLRKSIMAPYQHTIVVGDLSQIEPRVLAWLADYDELLDIFRDGGDPYATFGAQMFNIPGMTKESHGTLRQAAKSALLGCFGSQTPVLTKRGWVTILDVTSEDMLWDGAEWVAHQGLVPQGEKEVLTAHGVSATSDHEILTEHGWAAWSEALANPCLLQQATSLANLPVSDGRDAPTDKSGGVSSRISQKCAVPADGKVSWKEPTSGKVVLPGVTPAQKRKQRRPEWIVQAMKWFVPTPRTGSAYRTASAQLSCAARTRTVLFTQTTAGVALASTLRGWRTALNSCATSLASMVGINPNYSLIAQTTTGDTNQTISGLSPAVSTCRTSAKSQPEKLSSYENASQPLKQRMQTYDIAYAGPRNRYTILTDAGPLIVHNCGYGLGWASFAAQLLVGFLGAPPVRYTKEFAKALGVTSVTVAKFLDWPENVKKLVEIPHVCSMTDLVVHCLAAKAIIDKYRATAEPVVTLWGLFGNLIQYSLYEGNEYTHKCVTFKKGEIILPSGMSLLYPCLKPGKDEKGRLQWTYGKDETKLYSGKITNNVTQGVARCVMTDGMLRTAKRYDPVMTVHDEFCVSVPDAEVAEAKTWVLAQMVVEPKYMPGIPLAVEGGAHKRYGLAKN